MELHAWKEEEKCLAKETAIVLHFYEGLLCTKWRLSFFPFCQPFYGYYASAPGYGGGGGGGLPCPVAVNVVGVELVLPVAERQRLPGGDDRALLAAPAVLVALRLHGAGVLRADTGRGEGRGQEVDNHPYVDSMP